MTDIQSSVKRHVAAKQMAERIKMARQKSKQVLASQSALLSRQTQALVTYRTKIGNLEGAIEATKKKIPQTELLVEEARAEFEALTEELSKVNEEVKQAKAEREQRRAEEKARRKAA